MSKLLKSLVFTAILVLSLCSCKKYEGPGGNSAISGYVVGTLVDGANNELAVGPVIDERVYIIYGEEETYGETTRTDENGYYQFKDLTKGSYRVYTFTHDTATPTVNNYPYILREEVNAEITEKKTVVAAPDLNVFVAF